MQTELNVLDKVKAVCGEPMIEEDLNSTFYYVKANRYKVEFQGDFVDTIEFQGDGRICLHNDRAYHSIDEGHADEVKFYQLVEIK